MERQMGINEDVLRFLTIAVDELEEEPFRARCRRKSATSAAAAIATAP
jgi:ribosomal protein S6